MMSVWNQGATQSDGESSINARSMKRSSEMKIGVSVPITIYPICLTAIKPALTQVGLYCVSSKVAYNCDQLVQPNFAPPWKSFLNSHLCPEFVNIRCFSLLSILISCRTSRPGEGEEEVATISHPHPPTGHWLVQRSTFELPPWIDIPDKAPPPPPRKCKSLLGIEMESALSLSRPDRNCLRIIPFLFPFKSKRLCRDQRKGPKCSQRYIQNKTHGTYVL